MSYTPARFRRIVCGMTRRRQLAAGALVVAVLAGEVAGRWLAAHLPLVGHVPQRGHSGLDVWPAMVVAAKIGIALLLARLAWRFVKAQHVAAAAERALRPRRFRETRPLPTIGLSPRAWLVSFAAMSILYLAPTSTAELEGGGCWPLVTPWLHTQALPVFAVLAVVIAVLWRTLSRWLCALERYGERLRRLFGHVRALPVRRYRSPVDRGPRALFGLAFESRPPPAAA